MRLSAPLQAKQAAECTQPHVWLGTERGISAHHILVPARQHAPIGGRYAQRHGGVHLRSKLCVCDGHLLLEVWVLQTQQPSSGARQSRVALSQQDDKPTP